jgi:hypothetical protein
MEVAKDDRPAYSKRVLWEQWKQDLKDGIDPIPNLKHLLSDEELHRILADNPNLLMHSSKLGEDPGYIDPTTGEIKDCTYSNINDPKAVIGRKAGLRKGDICYFFKTGENKTAHNKKRKYNNKDGGIIAIVEKGNKLDTYTDDPKLASIVKLKEDLISAFMPHIRLILNYPYGNETPEQNKADTAIEKKIRMEIFGLAK